MTTFVYIKVLENERRSVRVHEVDPENYAGKLGSTEHIVSPGSDVTLYVYDQQSLLIEEVA